MQKAHEHRLFAPERKATQNQTNEHDLRKSAEGVKTGSSGPPKVRNWPSKATRKSNADHLEHKEHPCRSGPAPL